MKAIKLRAIVAGVLANGTLAFLTPQLSGAADMHQAGKGWDAFQSRGGEQLSSDSAGYTGTAMKVAPGQDWDVFHSRAEGAELVTHGQESTDMNSAFGKGWDAFHSRSGDRI